MNDKQVAFRLPTELVERLDRHAERLRQKNPGIRVSRADAVRLLLWKALELVDKEWNEDGEIELPEAAGGDRNIDPPQSLGRNDMGPVGARRDP
ncbi:MAG: hypothetical protein HN348_04010 [Proteobacteria bacterium]|nr:hypothetical protein [Pseudomonadota bacterium]